MSSFLYELHISSGGELVIKQTNIVTNITEKLDIYQFLWANDNRLCVILSELAVVNEIYSVYNSMNKIIITSIWIANKENIGMIG